MRQLLGMALEQRSVGRSNDLPRREASWQISRQICVGISALSGRAERAIPHGPIAVHFPSCLMPSNKHCGLALVAVRQSSFSECQNLAQATSTCSSVPGRPKIQAPRNDQSRPIPHTSSSSPASGSSGAKLLRAVFHPVSSSPSLLNPAAGLNNHHADIPGTQSKCP